MEPWTASFTSTEIPSNDHRNRDNQLRLPVLNVVTAPTGRVRAALLDEREETIAGFGFEDCEPVVGDHRQAVVRW